MGSRDLCRRKDVCGHFPEYGAIFMSNRSTLNECFEKRLFGLPKSLSGFVRRIKAGMILFNFEFEERKLYGVFEAISDGGTDIVPHAYSSSGRSFPAQVKFSTIWHCDPLFENDFRDAIGDNYYSTYKFNFGLSKDQVESLLWLFSSRKLKIPNSLHHNERKKRERDYKSSEGGLKKGRFKLNMNHGISVVAEPEVERLSLSPDSCRNSESIHFDDDAHDLKHLDFHHSEGSGAQSAPGDESHELQHKKRNLDISAEDTEDYIPLFSPDHPDLEEEGFDSRECSEKEMELGIFKCNQMSFIPVPQFPFGPILSNEGCNQITMEQPFASPPGGPCHSSDVSDFQSKDGSNHLKPMLSKGMYSDNLQKKTSVFSRLNFSSKYQNDASGKKLVNDLSRVKQQCHEKCEKVAQQADGFGEDMSMPEILEKLWHRHANWRNIGGRTDFLKQENEDYLVGKKHLV